ncbi:hypothetical protein MRB53_010555 [Persea americana]|uniref:Uncharacterized protein n=1 Tax=Persea americana TaxID=3435 RepID=A0ACC2LSW5_PERAE|nr:hypothetical protein MRB53_010555 [Persea americana]
MDSVSSTSSKVPANATFVLSNISHLDPTKLEHGNYHVWRFLFLPILLSHNLLGFVNGTKPCPPKFLQDSKGKLSTSVNPTYTEWIIQDQNLLTWINSTLSEGVLPYIVGLQSSKAIWDDLEKRYASLTSVHESDLLIHILDGLPVAYWPFKTTINTRSMSDPVTLDQLHALLICEELALEDTPAVSKPSTASTASRNPTIRGNQRRGSFNNKGRGRGRSNFRGSHNNSNQQNQ